MRFDTLDGWLHWQEGLHPTAMDLGLERVFQVVERCDWPARRFPLITVAGTNGKGSTVSYLEAIYSAAGLRTGTYTSPHLQRYNERIRIGRSEATDADIMRAFAHIDAARGDVTVTYFEYGTLAAMQLFHRHAVDVAIMEVGIGGRLDAVNVFDADVALVTTVDIDHRKWLGDDREAIGREKAGIFRAARPAISAERAPPLTLVKHAEEIGADLAMLGWHYDVAPESDGRWTFKGQHHDIRHLPAPGLAGAWQYNNAAGALAAVEALSDRCAASYEALAEGISNPGLRGRFQQLQACPEIRLDVAHNAQATQALADNLARHAVSGRSAAVVAMLNDKDLAEALQPLLPLVDHWYTGPTDGPRGLPAEDLAATLRRLGAERVEVCPSVAGAFGRARGQLGADDRLLVFGSFHTVGDVMDAVAEDDPARSRAGAGPPTVAHG